MWFWDCQTHGEGSLESTARKISHQICWAPTAPVADRSEMGAPGCHEEQGPPGLPKLQSHLLKGIITGVITTAPGTLHLSWLLFGNPFYTLGTVWMRTCPVFHELHLSKYSKDTLQDEAMNFPNCHFPIPSLCLRFRHISAVFSSPNIGRLLLGSLTELSPPQ